MGEALWGQESVFRAGRNLNDLYSRPNPAFVLYLNLSYAFPHFSQQPVMSGGSHVCFYTHSTEGKMTHREACDISKV